MITRHIKFIKYDIFPYAPSNEIWYRAVFKMVITPLTFALSIGDASKI